MRAAAALASGSNRAGYMTSITSRSSCPTARASPPVVSVVRNVASRRSSNPTLTSSSSSDTSTDTSGTAFSLTWLRTTSAKVNVAVNVPNRIGVLSVRSTIRISLGDWFCTVCTISVTAVSTNPVSVIIPAAIAPSVA